MFQLDEDVERNLSKESINGESVHGESVDGESFDGDRKEMDMKERSTSIEEIEEILGIEGLSSGLGSTVIGETSSADVPGYARNKKTRLPRLDDFELLTLLGKGAFGKVILAPQAEQQHLCQRAK